ncbi:hypothetical protein JDV02_000013 [Purpureocillium takamizusanense]|uniref:Uncharacterized protein n=1 Tax=Purpureocillium takamizusanense TaxID=2060973 RepID=A0A9Q8Q5U7_9HYPO|nr:uncharacterized protein JDV02_000013 [Purpureocillium takamizusanense]UNI13256.1 hypothetical protein JDV02_000013 [Purpureocillium takamizusanense]
MALTRTGAEPRDILRTGSHVMAARRHRRWQIKRAESHGAGQALDANANGDAAWPIPGKLQSLSSWALAPSPPTPAALLTPAHPPQLVLRISRLTNVMHRGNVLEKPVQVSIHRRTRGA